ncbi:hypothetical protein IQ216_03550 [Cyanobium sp. LEGE 06143]|uniref:Vgb family protein n=1 Tax=Cyanobium sp. LEGE 06143 TaxID=945727 RepID=UPI0018809E5C|nr:hypothetical protein [Cyanobium sp. LEGE 06143]MBE9172186.1 hypothetical protein [Cyanobium sp. LEGE 06143]
MNELSTVATAWALNNFLKGEEVRGPIRSLSVAQEAYKNLVRPSGRIAKRLTGIEESQETFFTLANILSSSIRNPAKNLDVFLDSAVNAQGGSASTTLEALVNLAKAPLNVSRELFALSLQEPTYSGGLPADSPPKAWVLGLAHFARNSKGVNPINGPGNIAIDKKGQLWITNNYTPFAPRDEPPFPGNTLINLDAGGNLIQRRPLKGGGLYGAGYGIGIDPGGQVWVGNYGFGGNNSFTNEPALIPLRGNGNSVSRFSPNGRVRSPNGSRLPKRIPTGGFTQGGMLGPQGTVSDQQGNIWIASSRETKRQSSKVVLYLDGKPRHSQNPRPFEHPTLSKPFDIAIDAQGDAWVTYTEGGRFGTGGVVELRYDRKNQRFRKRTYVDSSFDAPWGIAAAASGEIWFTNSGNRRGSTVSVIEPLSGRKELFTLSDKELGVWGISLDAQGNAYVNAFLQESVYVVSGKTQKVAGQVVRRGELLSPSEGYQFPGVLFRGTGLELDPAGNLWVANNYNTNPQNYGGRNIIQYVGLGLPVDTPLIGPVSPLANRDRDSSKSARILFSLSSKERLHGKIFQPEDIVLYNPRSDRYKLYFDGSQVGLGSAKVDAIDALTGRGILMSFAHTTTINGVTYDKSDIVEFTANSLGKRTRGSFSLFFDGSDVGLSGKSENIDAMSYDRESGDLLISTNGRYRVKGSRGSGEDIILFRPSRLGPKTKGRWSHVFDGSDVNLASKSENLAAISYHRQQLLLSTYGNYSAGKLIGVGSDILRFRPDESKLPASKTKGSFEVLLNQLSRNSIVGLDHI